MAASKPVTGTREASRSLINLYECYPCLFATETSDYHNRNKRQCALEAIAAKLQFLRPMTTSNDVKLKCNGLRSQFLKAYSLIKYSKKSGCSTDSVHVPTLWCYDSLKFLLRHTVHFKGTSNVPEVDTQEQDSLSDMENGFDKEFELALNEDCLTSKSCSEESLTSCTPTLLFPKEPLQTSSLLTGATCSKGRTTSSRMPSMKRKKAVEDSESADTLVANIEHSLKAVQARQASAEDNEFDAFGKMVAAELKKVGNPSLLRKLKRQLLNACMDIQDEDAELLLNNSNK